MYDRPKAERPVRFYERLLKLTAGRFLGKPFELAAWQTFVIAQIFGHVDSNGQRLVSEAFIQIAKKNGKSEWAAGLALYLLLADNEPAAEIYGTAASRAQAGLVFNVAAKMVGQSRELHDRLKVYRRSQRIVKRADPWSFYQVISADAYTGDGVNPHACIFDEIHRQRHTELYNVLKFGMSARSQGLMLGMRRSRRVSGIFGQQWSRVAEAAYIGRARNGGRSRGPGPRDRFRDRLTRTMDRRPTQPPCLLLL